MITIGSKRKSTVIHHHLSSIMTYQQPTHTHDNDNAEEASTLLTIATVSPAPSWSLGGRGGVPAGTKKNGVPTMRAMIVTTCFFLGTLAVIYGGRGSSHIRSGGSSADLLLLGHNYDPNSDHCFTDEANPGKYCWFHKMHYPCGNWQLDSKHGNNNCGPKCTQVLDTGFCESVDDDDDQ